MDSQNSSAPPHLHHHHHHHHHSQPQQPNAVLITPYTQTHPSNSFSLPNNTNSPNPTASNATMMQHQNPRFPFHPISSPANPSMDHHYPDGSIPTSGGDGVFSVESSRKKRGRPRKYSPDNTIGLGLSPGPVSQVPSAVLAQNHSGGGGGTPSSDNTAKKHRGRPPGSGKKQMDALGIPGVGFTPHVITVEVGEDIASKIMAFSQQGPRTVCVLSANGAVCNCTLRQASMSGGTVNYEGRFDIISLSGSFQMSENSSRTGSLSVSLAGSDGRVLGGGVAGVLKAATPVQVVVGSFIPDGKKPKPSSRPSPTTTTPPPTHMLTFGGGHGQGVISPSPGIGSSSESGEENDVIASPPTIQNHGGPGHNNYNSNAGGQSIPLSMPMYSNMGWANSMKMLPN